jgi:hypothetical protein
VAGGRHSLRVKVDAPERAEELLRGLGFVTAIVRGERGNLDLTLDHVDDESSIAITRALVTAGIGVAEVVKESESLEERFLEITSTADATETEQATP